MEIAKTDTRFLALCWDTCLHNDFFVISKAFDLAQVFIALLLVFLDHSDVNSNGGNTRTKKLAQYLTLVQIKVFLGR